MIQTLDEAKKQAVHLVLRARLRILRLEKSKAPISQLLF